MNCSKSPPAGVQPGNSELISTLNCSIDPCGSGELDGSIVREKVPGAVSCTEFSMNPAPWVRETVTGVVSSLAHSGISIDPLMVLMPTVGSSWVRVKLPVGLVVRHQ